MFCERQTLSGLDLIPLDSSECRSDGQWTYLASHCRWTEVRVLLTKLGQGHHKRGSRNCVHCFT